MKRRNRAALAIAALVALAVVAAVVYSFIPDRRDAGPSRTSSTSSLLALTWGPTLCRVEPSTSGCKTGHVGKLGQAFLLHGLWPQPSSEQYCELPKRSADHKSVDLPAETRNTLRDMMSDEKFMASHEWFAHGTCSGVTPPEYFSIATTLTRQASTVLNPVFAKADGKRLSAQAVRDAVDAAFGRGTGQRVSLTCRDLEGRGPVVYEVRLSLPAVVDLRAEKNLSLADSLTRGPATPPGCGKGTVVP